LSKQHPTALRRFAVGEHALEFLPFDALLLVRRRRLFDHLTVDHHVVEPVGHPGFRRLPITAGTPGFLIVRFEALGQIEMGHEANVGLSIPMPKAIVATITRASSRRKRCW
jgi:hypothetical protein